MENVNRWSSNDFYLCTIVLATGHTLLALNKQSAKFVTFVFDLSPLEAEKIIADHWSRKLQVPTRDLIEAINELKTRLHSGV